MSISLLSFLKTYEPLQKARKASSGQFILVHDWIKHQGNTSDTIDSDKRAQAKRQLTGAGKISPEDFKQIADNRNLDLIGFLADRGDLSMEQANYILNSDVAFEGTRHHYGPGNGEKYVQIGHNAKLKESADRSGFNSGWDNSAPAKKKRALYDKLIPKAMGASSNWQNFLENVSEDVLHHIASQRKLSSSDTFHIITQRARIGDELLKNLMQNSNIWRSEHLVELMNRPESHLKQLGLIHNGSRCSPELITSILRSNDNKMISALVSNDAVDLSDVQLYSVLSNPDQEVSKAAAKKLGYMLHQPNHYEDRNLSNLLDHALNRLSAANTATMINSWRSMYSPESVFHMNQAQKGELLNKVLANPSDLMSKGLLTVADWQPHEVDSIAQTAASMPSSHYSSRNETLGYIMDKRPESISEGTVRQILAGPVSENSGFLENLIALPVMTPDLIDTVASHIKMMDNSFRKNNAMNALLDNTKTSPDTIVSVFGNNLDGMSHGLKTKMASGAATPRALWEKLAFGDDVHLRSVAATNPQATSEDVSKGLVDLDPSVRQNWIRATPHEKLTPDHWASIKADKSPNNRAAAISSHIVPQEVMRHFLLKDKASSVNLAALGGLMAQIETTENPAEHAALLDEAVKQINPHTLVKFSREKAFSQEQTDLIHRRLVEDHAVKLAKLNKQAQGAAGMTPEVFHQKATALEQQHKESLYGMTRWNNLSHQTVKHIVGGMYPSQLQGGLRNLRMKNLMHQDHWDSLLDRTDLPDRLTEEVLSFARPSPERWRKIASALNPEHYDTQNMQRYLATNNSVPIDVVRPFVEHGHPSFLLKYAGNSEADPELLTTAYNVAKANAAQGRQFSAPSNRIGSPHNYNADLIHGLTQHSNASPELLEQIYNDLLTVPSDQLGVGGNLTAQRIRSTVVQHSRMPNSVLQRALNDPYDAVKNYAMESIGKHDPDMVNGAIGGHEIYVSPAVEKLKDLKGQIENLGGTVNKKDLPNKGQGVPSQMLDGKGNVSTASEDQFIDKLPKDKYNVSYTDWNGAQRHDKTKPQKVLQLNMTNAHVNAIKEAGLWDVFNDVHESSFRSGHPVRKHSLGWARIDDHKPGHWHIDEIQSDLGQGSIRLVEKAKEDGRISPEKAEKYISGIKSLIKIFSGSFKSINHAIHAAVHQAGREQGVTTTSMDDLYDQAKQSNMKTHSNTTLGQLGEFYDGTLDPDDYAHGAIKKWATQHNVLNNRDLGMDTFTEQLPAGAVSLQMENQLPGHMLQTYSQIPADYGYKPANKKEIMPETNAPEETVQYRKLVKSLKRIHELCEALSRLKK